MNNPNTIENQVLTILKENTDARNDDMKLYLLVCNRCYQRYENQDIGGLPFAVIMNCYKELHLPHLESVRRSRAKLQASHPELAPSPEVQRGRKRCEHIAVFKTVVYTDSPESFKYYQFVNADTEDEFNAYITKCKELALYDTGVTAEYGDKLITLSTCEYSRNNGRMVVVAKKIAE